MSTATTKKNNTRIEAYGTKGFRATPWRKTFTNQLKFEQWVEATEESIGCTVIGVRILWDGI